MWQSIKIYLAHYSPEVKQDMRVTVRMPRGTEIQQDSQEEVIIPEASSLIIDSLPCLAKAIKGIKIDFTMDNPRPLVRVTVRLHGGETKTLHCDATGISGNGEVVSKLITGRTVSPPPKQSSVSNPINHHGHFCMA